MGDVNNKIMNIFKTNTTKDYSKPKCVKNVYGVGKKPMNLIKENEAIKDRINRYIKTHKKKIITNR